MTHTSSANNSGMMFGPAAIGAGLAALMSKELMEQQRLAQEAKKSAQEAQQLAAQTTCDASVEIGQNEKTASYADGMGSIASGIAMGSAEVLGLGINLAGSCKTAQTTETIQNNKNCRDILANPDKAKSVKVQLGAPDAPMPSAEQITAAKARLDNWNPDKDLNNYGEAKLNDNGEVIGDGEATFRSDITALNLSGEHETIQAAKDRTEKKLKENTKTKQSQDAQFERYTGIVKTAGQVAGQCATGAKAMERGEQQEEKGEEECLKAEGDFLNASARGNADTLQKVGDLASSTDQLVEQAYKGLIDANRA